MTDPGTVRLRLLRDDPQPPSPDGSAFRFGLQDRNGQLHDGIRRADGMIVFDLDLRVAEGTDPARPVFSGPFASGGRDDRFIYLSWQRVDGRSYINRIKVRLADLDWSLIHAARAGGGVIEADMSGRAAGGGRRPVEWRVVHA
ncbi:hypothetical protein GCM10009087_27300 [Sphingomonas oligophenolica]|uniref:DUF5990 family protein n=1 Tax=Sphingomonas oligophenolica TaxID=301154 RepID=A0ABU9Y4E8_9SPHN